ncbi:uncharacterized protein B0I36DRAFT_363377 [Microdochium trichocladiopsis]|uniref:Uncharacterized protein n=1 Tax=Microdochium trichocladiopsis TaxID=1682393 RepID=A0A9P8Y5C9_9PEZI|nr:uncharacterized protein B0I36DRAFT_363377 [Microdochium trichocladiopsis]KAH7028753.1 hypothetical protein B0I36DRAFT_363377 [Microdochium trichocladiopsis]
MASTAKSCSPLRFHPAPAATTVLMPSRGLLAAYPSIVARSTSWAPWKILATSLAEYDSLLRDRYDHNFDLYAKAVVANGSSVVQNFMDENGNDYFTCVVHEIFDSCEHCRRESMGGSLQCRYCEIYNCGWDSCAPDFGCAFHTFRFREINQSCRPDYSLRGGNPPEPPF